MKEIRHLTTWTLRGMKHIILIDSKGVFLTINADLNLKTIFEIETSNISSIWTPMSSLYITTKTAIGVVRPFMESTDDVWCEGGVV